MLNTPGKIIELSRELHTAVYANSFEKMKQLLFQGADADFYGGSTHHPYNMLTAVMDTWSKENFQLFIQAGMKLYAYDNDVYRDRLDSWFPLSTDTAGRKLFKKTYKEHTGEDL